MASRGWEHQGKYRFGVLRPGTDTRGWPRLSHWTSHWESHCCCRSAVCERSTVALEAGGYLICQVGVVLRLLISSLLRDPGLQLADSQSVAARAALHSVAVFGVGGCILISRRLAADKDEDGLRVTVPHDGE